jgi:hypothetical protein
MLYSIDMRDILPSVHVPVVVMNRTADPVANIEAARDVAARIPGARFVELPGDTHPFFTGPATGEILAEIETFVTGVRPPPAADRVLATVLFTDIAGSAQKLEAIGDHRWRQLLDSHHAQVRQLLERYAGTEIDTAGDGFFATFDGPTRAIRCACAIGDRSRRSVWRSTPACIPARSNAKGPTPPASRCMSAHGSPPWPSQVKCSSLLPSNSSCRDLESTSPTAERTPSKASQTSGSCLPWCPDNSSRAPRKGDRAQMPVGGITAPGAGSLPTGGHQLAQWPRRRVDHPRSARPTVCRN